MRQPILIRFVLLISLIALIWSCKKEPDLLGLDLIPESDLLNHEYIDTVSIEAITIREDSLVTEQLSTSLLGSINDPVFGRTTASIYTQFILPGKDVNFGTNPVVDSIFLTLPYKGLYGDKNATHHVRVYELTDSIRVAKDVIYYQSSTLPVGSTLIGEATFVPNLKDSVKIDSKKTVPLMKVPLTNEFAQSIVTSDAVTLSIHKEFRKKFKGLFITVDDATTPGTGAIMYLNPESEFSRINMYYHFSDKDSIKATKFQFGLTAQRFLHFDHDGYQGADPNLLSQFDGNSSSTGEKLFLQSNGGAKIKLSFPHLTNLASKKMVIHEATLVVESADTSKNYPIPALLGLRKLTEKGKYNFLPDESIEGSSFIGGVAKDDEYRIRITRYVQNRLLNPDEEDYGLMLLVGGASISGNRAVIKGPEAGEGRMRLLIYYTPLK